MRLEEEIRTRIATALAPEVLRVANQSHLHAGHSGDDGSGESHWLVEIRAQRLDGISRLARHRAIHDAVGADLIARIHALQISFV